MTEILPTQNPDNVEALAPNPNDVYQIQSPAEAYERGYASADAEAEIVRSKKRARHAVEQLKQSKDKYTYTVKGPVKNVVREVATGRTPAQEVEWGREVAEEKRREADSLADKASKEYYENITPEQQAADEKAAWASELLHKIDSIK